jgi:hypothetical protein
VIDRRRHLEVVLDQHAAPSRTASGARVAAGGVGRHRHP